MDITSTTVVQVCADSNLDSCEWIPVSEIEPGWDAFGLTIEQGTELAMAFWGLLATVFVMKKLWTIFH